MLEMPILKFENSTKYLKSQINIQRNNKQLVLEIIAHINYTLKNNPLDNKEQYEHILEIANLFLKIFISNVTSIQQLEFSIENITSDLYDILSTDLAQPNAKEYYLTSLKTLKDSIIMCSKRIKKLEFKLVADNNNFIDFLAESHVKYNYNAASCEYEFLDICFEEPLAKEVKAESNEISIEEPIETNTLVDNVDATTDVETSIFENVPELESTVDSVNESSSDNIVETQPEVEIENIETPTIENVDNNSNGTIVVTKEEAEPSRIDFSSLEKSFKEFDDLLSTPVSENAFQDMILDDNIGDVIVDKPDECIVDEDIIIEDNNIVDHIDIEEPTPSEDLSSISDKIATIEEGQEDNENLIISAKTNKIYLPYKRSELIGYINSYPNDYESLKDVVHQEFIVPYKYFETHPTKVRYFEAYNLIRNREGQNWFKSVAYALRIARMNSLNPAIVASCKSKQELDSYIDCLNNNKLDSFKFFQISYEVNPV